MAITSQQNRPVTAFAFTVTTLTGAVATVDTWVKAAFTGASDTEETIVVADSGANGTVKATFSVAADGLGDFVITPVVVGTDYVATDAISLDATGFSGITVGTLTTTALTIVGEAATTTVTVGGTGFVVGDIISTDELTSDLVGTGLALTVASITTPATGDVATVTVTAGGTGYVTGDAETVTYSGTGEIGISDVRYSNHAQYETGGAETEYLGLTKDGSLTYDKSSYTPVGLLGDDQVLVKTVLKADQAQWIVQQRDIAGIGQGSSTDVVVFAEPTTVDRNGNVVGNVARAEDCVDEDRCIANGFFWNRGATSTGDAGQGSYGYCMTRPNTFDPTAFVDSDGDAGTDDAAGCLAISGVGTAVYVTGSNVCTLVAASVADCPTGYKFNGGTGCTLMTYAEVNALDSDDFDLARECAGAGLHWESSESVVTEQCKPALVADTFSFATFVDSATSAHFATTSTAQQYARTTCEQFGFRWYATDMTCIADSDHSVLTTKATCVDAGHVWIAGTCYDGADFGDGQNRTGSFQQDPTDLPE